jgi:hypothetical protein
VRLKNLGFFGPKIGGKIPRFCLFFCAKSTVLAGPGVILKTAHTNAILP